MAGNIRLEIVTPEKSVLDEEAQIVMLPGSLGEFGVLVGHTPFLSTLKLGTIRYKDTKGDERCVFVSGGYAEAMPDHVTVLADSAERRCDIDIERARVALDRAKARLEGAREQNIDYARARAALERALHRMRMAETGRR